MASSAMSRKQLLQEIKEKTEGFQSDKCNSNNIIDLLGYLEIEDGVTIPCIQALQKVFTHLIRERAMYQRKKSKNNEELTAEEKYKLWLLERYEESFERIAQLLSHAEIKIQEKALSVLLQLLSEESKNFSGSKKSCHCSLKRWRLVLAQLLSNDVKQHLIRKLQDYTAYDDVRRCILKSIQLELKESPSENSEEFTQNVLNLLELVCRDAPEKTLSSNLLCACEGGVDLREKYGSSTSIIREIWPVIAKWKLTPSTTKALLIIIPNKILPHLQKPLLLTDFFINSYNLGGAVGLLALQGVFVLMQKYNLEYPDFYTKLYSLLEPRVLGAKYRARFFHLMDLFLSSTHLPEYLAAAFAKRLARLSLQSPPEATFLLLRFVGNLLLRHPGLKCLIHRPDGPQDFSQDPFLMEEEDPAQSRALESSLWEIQTLQSHLLPEVAQAARFIQQPLPKVEWELDEWLELSAAEMMEREMGKEAEDFPLCHKRPLGLGLKHWTF